MHTIKKFDPVSTGKIAGLFYLFIGVLFTIFLVVVAIVSGLRSNPSDEVSVGGALLFGGIGTLVYGIFGFLATYISCYIYNLVAEHFGGIKIELALEESSVPPPPESRDE